MEGGKTVSKAAYKTAKTNKIKRSRADLIFDIILYTIGTILILITLYPMYFIVIASISDPQLVSNGEIMFIPRGVSLKAYKQLLGYTRLWTGYRNTIIYGHNMKDGSMFGTLDQYQSQALYRNYPYFYMYVPGYIYEYQIFSCYAAPTDHPAYTYDFPTSEDYEVFLETLQRSAEYNTGMTVTKEDQVVTLSTCVNTRKDYRYLVHGKLKQKIKMEE